MAGCGEIRSDRQSGARQQIAGKEENLPSIASQTRWGLATAGGADNRAGVSDRAAIRRHGVVR